MESRHVNPMKLGEVLDASFRLYRERFSLLLLAQLPMAAFFVLTVLVGDDTTEYTKKGSSEYYML